MYAKIWILNKHPVVWLGEGAESKTPLNLVNEYVCLPSSIFHKATLVVQSTYTTLTIMTLLTNQTGENIIKQHAFAAGFNAP